MTQLLEKKEFVIASEVRKKRHMQMQTHKNINSYRGLRHLNNLPVRGQRTCSNAKTRKKHKIN